MLSVSSQSETDPQLCELSLSSDEEPEAKNSKDVPVDVPSAGELLYRYLFAFVWRYQLPLAQDFIQAMADIS